MSQNTIAQIFASRAIRMLLSSIVAGALAGFIAQDGGANIHAALTVAAITSLKDIHAYLSTSPFQPIDKPKDAEKAAVAPAIAIVDAADKDVPDVTDNARPRAN